MALIKCKECGKEISDTIKKCIHCGAKINKNTSNMKKENKKLELVEEKKIKNIGKGDYYK